MDGRDQTLAGPVSLQRNALIDLPPNRCIWGPWSYSFPGSMFFFSAKAKEAVEPNEVDGLLCYCVW